MYNNLGCSGCHGAGGNSMVPSYPSLAGKDAGWLVQQLKDFQSGARIDPTMNAMAPMAAGHEQAIADFLSGK
jgi:cytochrome c553